MPDLEAFQEMRSFGVRVDAGFPAAEPSAPAL